MHGLASTDSSCAVIVQSIPTGVWNLGAGIAASGAGREDHSADWHTLSQLRLRKAMEILRCRHGTPLAESAEWRADFVDEEEQLSGKDMAHSMVGGRRARASRMQQRRGIADG